MRSDTRGLVKVQTFHFSELSLSHCSGQSIPMQILIQSYAYWIKYSSIPQFSIPMFFSSLFRFKNSNFKHTVHGDFTWRKVGGTNGIRNKEVTTLKLPCGFNKKAFTTNSRSYKFNPNNFYALTLLFLVWTRAGRAFIQTITVTIIFVFYLPHYYERGSALYSKIINTLLMFDKQRFFYFEFTCIKSLPILSYSLHIGYTENCNQEINIEFRNIKLKPNSENEFIKPSFKTWKWNGP